MEESRARSLLKAISYRVIVLLLDFSFVYLFTRRFDVATVFVIVSNLYTMVAYYLHERAWNAVAWGKTGTAGIKNSDEVQR